MVPNIFLLSVYKVVTQETFLTIGFKSTLIDYRARVCPHIVISKYLERDLAQKYVSCFFPDALPRATAFHSILEPGTK